MHGAKGKRGQEEGRDAVACPVFEPLLEHAAEEKFFAEGYHPERREKGSGDFPGGLKAGVVQSAESQREGKSDRGEIEIVHGAGAPFVRGGDEAVAGFGDAAFEHQSHDRHLDEGEVAENDKIEAVHGCGIDGVEEMPQKDRGDEEEEGEVAREVGGQDAVPEGDAESEGGEAEESGPLKGDGAAAADEVGKDGGGEQVGRESAGNAFAHGRKGRHQIEWIFRKESGG